jgi:hypothetical protein
MGGSAGVVGSIVRAATAVATGGTSELTRKKPFQPGGETDPVNVAAGAAGGLGLGVGGAASLVGVGAGLKALSAKPPSVDTSPIDVSNKAQEAANAVQTADAEGRRARAAKRQSSVLGSYQANQQTNAATLQPAQPRRSVLG